MNNSEGLSKADAGENRGDQSPAGLTDACSAQLWRAEWERRRIAPLSSAHPRLSEDDIYAIAARTFQRRDRQKIGFKLGYTSAEMRAQMGINDPNFGVLTKDLLVSERTGRVDSENLFHPLIEPEITLRVGRDVHGPDQTRVSISYAVDSAIASLEIVHTRYQSYCFSAVDNIADNSSSARVVLGRLDHSGRSMTCACAPCECRRKARRSLIGSARTRSGIRARRSPGSPISWGSAANLFPP